MKSRFVSITILILLFVFPLTVAVAPPPQVDTPSASFNLSLPSFLVWLTAGGAVIAVSWISEQSTAFQALEPNKKKWLQYGASALLGCAALAVNQFVPQDVLLLLTPYFAVLAGTFGMIFLNQFAHSNDPNRKPSKASG